MSEQPISKILDMEDDIRTVRYMLGTAMQLFGDLLQARELDGETAERICCCVKIAYAHNEEAEAKWSAGLDALRAANGSASVA